MNTIEMPLLYSSSSSSNSSSSSSTSKSSLGMTDFLKLLAAQFENQDITNPTDNTEFVSELAQFSSLEAMTTLEESANKQYASSLIGKTVEVQGTDSIGSTTLSDGVVKSASFSGDTVTLTVNCNGKDGTYDLSKVTKVIGSSSSDSTSGSSSSSDTSDSSSSGSTSGT